MDVKSTTKMIDKDLKKLNRNYAKGKYYIEGIIKEQEVIIKTIEVEISKINEELIKSKKRLEPYLKDKEFDGLYYEEKRKYEQLLIDRNTYQKAINIATESIESAKLHEI